MSDPRETNAANAQQPARASLKSEDLGLHLNCPKCRTVAWVLWRQLPHLLRCSGCSNSFWISKTGHIESEHECGTKRIVCPRCHQSHTWPTNAPLKHFRCRGCSFDIPLNDTESPSLIERLTGNTPASAGKESREPKQLSRGAIFGILAAIFGTIALLVAGVIWVMTPDKDLIQSANRFTVASALGDTDKALDWVTPGQQTQYKHWRTVNFSTRSLSSSDRLEVSIKEYRSTIATVKVQLGSGQKDRLVLNEIWSRSSDGKWQFDADATLKGANTTAAP